MNFFNVVSTRRTFEQGDLDPSGPEEPIISVARHRQMPRLDPSRVADRDEGLADSSKTVGAGICSYEPWRAHPAAERAMQSISQGAMMYLPYYVRLLPPYTATWSGASGKSYEFGVTEATYPLRDGPAVIILVDQPLDGKAVPLWVGSNTWDATDGGWHLDPEVLRMVNGARQRARMHVRFEAVWDNTRTAEIEDLIAELDPPLNATVRPSVAKETIRATPIVIEQPDVTPVELIPDTEDGIEEQEAPEDSSVEPAVLVDVPPPAILGPIPRRPVLTTLNSKVGRFFCGAWRATAVCATSSLSKRLLKRRQVKAEIESLRTATMPIVPSEERAPLTALRTSDEFPSDGPASADAAALLAAQPEAMALDARVALTVDDGAEQAVALARSDPAPSNDTEIVAAMSTVEDGVGRDQASATTVMADVPVQPSGSPNVSDHRHHRATVLFAGEMSYNAGIDILVDATAVVAGDPTDATFVFVGDGPMKSEMEARATCGGFADRCRFPGHLEAKDLAALVDTADIVVVPARVPQDPTVSRQAIDTGRWVLSTHQAQIGGIEHGRNGLLTYDNPGSLVWGIRELLARVAEQRH